jgi:5-methylcytosine-specific restriction endonuclease McrBC GTP-binding regulatory subunit McrB
MVLPFILSVSSTNRAAGNITLEFQATLNHAYPLSDLNLHDLNSGTQHYLHLTKERFDAIIQQLGGLRMDEKALLEHIHRFIAAEGYYFDWETLVNYHICLKTRPFVILAGLSGTGKSKLSQLYAKALGHKTHYLRLPVRPNWSDDRYLLGYFNTITNTYMTAPAVEFLLKANADEENIYFFCLDEMNLAHVEYYFSQFLSAMEEAPGERSITLLSESEQAQLHEKGAEISVLDEQTLTTGKVQIPSNFLVTGTINVDETTKPVSDKVMDRANTLEFFQVDLDKLSQPVPAATPSLVLGTSAWKSYQATQGNTTYRSKMKTIGQILNKADLGLGYRVLYEIELYLANSAGLLDLPVAFDLQVKQRILPRVRGSEVISGMLSELHEFFVAEKLERSVERLGEIQRRLKRDGYTSFWR